MALKVGDVVRLKSGGPPMTVENVSPESDRIGCSWFVDNKQLERGMFGAEMLEPAERGGAKATLGR